MVRHFLLILTFTSAALFISGCASETEKTSVTDTGRVNTIPWNRPEQWEGQGSLGGMLNSR